MISITLQARICSSNKGIPLAIPLIIAVLVTSFAMYMTISSIPALAQDVANQYCTTTGSYQVCTDQADYSPTQTVHISGFGFAPDSSYLIKVTRPDGTVVTGDGTFTLGYDSVTTDSNGNFQYDYILDGVLGNYTIEVLDSGNNTLATHTFTDGSKIASATSSPATQTVACGASTATYTISVRRGGGSDATGADLSVVGNNAATIEVREHCSILILFHFHQTIQVLR